MKYASVKDSGRRQVFDTGSRRDTREGKGRYDLMSPLALERIARHFENGAKKYGDRNWERGQPLARYIDSGVRHAFKHLSGMRDEDHLAAAAWNFMAAIHTEMMIERGMLPPQLNDLPDYTGRPKRGPKTAGRDSDRRANQPRNRVRSRGRKAVRKARPRRRGAR